MCALNVSMRSEELERVIQEKFTVLKRVLDERGRRWWAAIEAKSLGYGGPTLVAKATGMARSTIYQGLRELEDLPAEFTRSMQHVRAPGGGRKPLTKSDPTLLAALESLMEPRKQAGAESPLRWTCQSTHQLAVALQRQGHRISRQKVADLLAELGYNLRNRRKVKASATDPDCDAQFNHVLQKTMLFQERGQPVVSVEIRKNRLTEKSNGHEREWCSTDNPDQRIANDLIDRTVSAVNSSRKRKPAATADWVNEGVDQDTADLAVESLRRWWIRIGQCAYPRAKELLVTVDDGGISNKRWNQLWKVALQRLTNDLALPVTVCHFPPGTSKWSEIEPQIFSNNIVRSLDEPLARHEAVVNLIANKGVKRRRIAQPESDTGRDSARVTVTVPEVNKVALKKDTFYGQ